MTNKPTMNKISLECIVGAQVLCEFLDPKEGHGRQPTRLGFLNEIIDIKGWVVYAQDNVNNSNGNPVFKVCRIYQHPDYWISNHDGELVLPDGLMVECLIREGSRYNTKSSLVSLKHGVTYDDPDDIIAVRVIGTASQWGY